MKILIISANNEMEPDPVFPIGATYVATALIKKGYDVETFDRNFKGKKYTEKTYDTLLKNKLDTFKPDIIGISLRNVDDVQFPNYTSYIEEYKEIVDLCKKNSDAPIILGGPGYSLFPKKFIDYLNADYGVVGEGEEGLIRMLENIKEHKQHEKIMFTKKLDMKKFDIIPNRKLFDFKTYYSSGGMLNIQTKRGCAFNCSYCTYPFIEGSKVRMRDPANVVDEIEFMINEYKIRYFFIVDSVFNFPEKHALDICNEIIKRKLKIKWSAYIRPVMKDLDIVNAMKEAGCKSIELGTDSMAEPTIRSMQKKFKIDDVFKFCERCYDVLIDYAHSLIFGAPGETFETVKTTVKNVQATDPTAILAFIGLRILPNTPLADYCINTGFIKSYDEINFNPIFYIEKAISEGIINFLKDVMKDDPRWIIPGIKAFDVELFQSIRKKKKGLMWEMKKFIDFID